ncbi:MAG: hypothetical protein U9N50_00960 [Pseudomonadota bacterium]|nr:hypothetical protein [Pseudomonadota bacterium]
MSGDTERAQPDVTVVHIYRVMTVMKKNLLTQIVDLFMPES